MDIDFVMHMTMSINRNDMRTVLENRIAKYGEIRDTVGYNVNSLLNSIVAYRNIEVLYNNVIFKADYIINVRIIKLLKIESLYQSIRYFFYNILLNITGNIISSDNLFEDNDDFGMVALGMQAVYNNINISQSLANNIVGIVLRFALLSKKLGNQNENNKIASVCCSAMTRKILIY